MAHRSKVISSRPRRSRRGFAGVVSGFGVAALVWSCAESSELVAVQTPASGKTTTVAQSTSPIGVRVAADSGAWQDEQVAPLASLAVKVTIANERSTPIHISRGDIALVGTKETQRALAPNAVTVREIRTTLGEDPANPDPGLGPINTASPDLRGSTNSDIGGGVVTQQAAKREAVKASLPEGAIPPGHEVQGYVYFERMPEIGERLDLELGIKGSADGPLITTVAVPFRVAQE